MLSLPEDWDYHMIWAGAYLMLLSILLTLFPCALLSLFFGLVSAAFMVIAGLMMGFPGISVTSVLQTFIQIILKCLFLYIAVMPVIAFAARIPNGHMIGTIIAFTYGSFRELAAHTIIHRLITVNWNRSNQKAVFLSLKEITREHFYFYVFVFDVGIHPYISAWSYEALEKSIKAREMSNYLKTERRADTYIPARENMTVYQDAVRLVTASGKWQNAL